MAKVLGTYEKELHGIIETFANGEFDVVVNLGAGEGYYAVGLARRQHAIPVVVYEALEEGRRLIQEVAAKNEVDDRLDVRGMCTREALESLFDGSKRYLVIADVEGDEIELFQPNVIELLRKSSLIVESHDFKIPRCTEELTDRFGKTHVITVISSTERSCADFPLRVALPCRVKLWSMNEGRPTRCGPMRWLVMTPR